MLQNAPAELPSIIVSESDESRLTALATAATLTGRSHDAARVLLTEMERAQVVPDQAVSADVVRMQSLVTFEVDGGVPRRVLLVFPGEANIDQNKISILTPIGAALIGLSRGQTISLNGQDGRPHRLTVLMVAPAPALAIA
jgi:regulator of nucleoside diphosphate kinase